MRSLAVGFLSILLLLGFVSPMFAASKKTTTAAIYVAPTFLKTKNVVRVTFSGLKNAKKVSYTLMYQGNGVGQGVVGSFVPGKKTALTKDMFLGTCSGKVCIKHKNIKGLQLQVTTTYKNGASTSKTYKIRS